MPSIDNVEDVSPVAGPYVALAAQTDFEYNFPIFEDGDLVVDVDGVTKALGTDYTVTGEGEDTGGTVTFLVAMTGDEIVTIYRDIPIERTSDFQQNGPWTSRAVNDEFDRITMILQQLESLVGRSVRLALTNPQASADLVLDANFEDKFLYVNSDGELEPAANLTTTTLTQSVIGALLNPIVDEETTAGLVVADLDRAYGVGVLERYKLVGDGVTDDTAAMANAALVSAQGIQLLGTPGKTYVLASGITCGSIFDLDLRGATIKPSGNSGRLTSTAATATATTTVSSGATQGSRSVIVASATGISTSQWARITASNFPAFWAKVTSTAGTTLEFDRTLPVTYAGTINISTYSAINDRFRLVNGVFDGDNVTASAGNSGQALRVLSYGRVELDALAFKNYEPGTGNRPLHVDGCVDVIATRLQAFDNDIPTSDNIAHFTGCRKVNVSHSIIQGGGFGFNIDLTETAIVIGNILSGRRKYEDQESVSPAHSVRGIKVTSCGYALVQGNDVSDFETSIKVENYHRFVVTGNTVRNAGLYTYDGQAAIGATSSALPGEPFGIISDNLIENVGGNAIMIDTSGATTTDANAIVQGNLIRSCGRHAIYCGQQKISVLGNKIEDWNTSNTGSGTSSAAVFHNGGGIIAIGNTFENSDATDCCFTVSFVSGQTYDFRGNARLSANPYFDGSKVIERDDIATATIASGSTSIAANHNLVRSPAVREIFLEHTSNPTNDPGILWISAISSTQITISCRNDPGAGGMNVTARIIPQMPFTV